MKCQILFSREKILICRLLDLSIDSVLSVNYLLANSADDKSFCFFFFLFFPENRL